MPLGTILEGAIFRAGSRKAIVSASVTRPDDTIPYGAGDAIADVTTTPTLPLVFSNIARVSGGSGRIVSAFLIDSANQTVKGDYTLLLFSQIPTLVGDNVLYELGDAQVEDRMIGFISWRASDARVTNGGAGAAGNVFYRDALSSNVVEYVCHPTVSDIYGVLVTDIAYTPVSRERWTIRLVAEQD